MSRSKTNRARIGISLSLLILLLGAVAWHYGSAAVMLLTPLSERYRQEGDALLAEGNLAEAVLTYRQAVEADGSNIRALQSLAGAYAQQGRMRMAERYQAQAENRQPDYRLPEALPHSGLTPVWIAALSEAPPLGGTLVVDRLVSSHENGTVAAVGLETGKILWSQKLPAAATSAPGAGKTVTAVGASNGNLYGLSLVDGQILWQVPTGGPVYATPLFHDGVIYCPSNSGAVFALKETDGSIIWKRDFGSPMNGTPASADGVVFIGSNNGRLYALHASDGSLAWPDGIMTGGPVESQPHVAVGRVIFGSGDGRVYALDPATGGQYWRYSTPDSIYAQPLVLAERTFIASSGRSLSAVDTLSGERVWQVMLPAPLRRSPRSSGGLLYLMGDSDPNLYILDQETGEQKAAVPAGDWLADGPWLTEENGPMLYLLGKDGALLAFQVR